MFEKILLLGNTFTSTLIICQSNIMQYVLYYITCDEHKLVCDYFTQLNQDKSALYISGFPIYKVYQLGI